MTYNQPIMTCRLCSLRIRFIVTRSVWVHVEPGADHGPIPEKGEPR